MVLFILFPSVDSHKFSWQKDIIDKKVVKSSFVKELKKLGKVHIYYPEIYNYISYHENPSHKFNTKPTSFNYEELDMNKECKKIYKQIKSHKDKFIPIGHSTGGLFAFHFSKLYPKKCSKVILIESSSVLNSEAKKYFLSKKDNIQNIIEKNKDIDVLYDTIVCQYYKKFKKQKKKINVLLFNRILITDDANNDNEINNLYYFGVQELYSQYNIKVVHLINTNYNPWFIQRYNTQLIQEIKSFC